MRRSSISSATPRSAWAPTRARPRTWRRSRSWSRPRVAPSRMPATRPSGRPSRRSRSARSGRAAGALFAPVRRTPIQDWHERAGAVFEDVGAWRRPRFFPQAGETMATAVARECRAARAAVAMIDASTLGKIDVQGPDAARFLDRIYANNVADLAIGRCRYGVMLDEKGMI